MLPLYNIKTWLLPCLCTLQTMIMYQYDAWSWIRVWVNTVLKLSINEYGKAIYSSSLDNGKVNLLRSLVVTKAICAEKEGYMGLAGQRNTLMQCTPSIMIIHRLLVLQSISGEWKMWYCTLIVCESLVRMVCSEICAWNNENWLVKCFDHHFTVKHNTVKAKVGVGVILSHDGCHGYYIIIYKTKLSLVMPRVLIEYNLNHIWYAFLNRFLRHGLPNFLALLKWK